MNETLLFNTKELSPETFFQKLNQLLRKFQALGDFLAHVSDDNVSDDIWLLSEGKNKTVTQNLNETIQHTLAVWKILSGHQKKHSCTASSLY